MAPSCYPCSGTSGSAGQVHHQLASRGFRRESFGRNARRILFAGIESRLPLVDIERITYPRPPSPLARGLSVLGIPVRPGGGAYKPQLAAATSVRGARVLLLAAARQHPSAGPRERFLRAVFQQASRPLLLPCLALWPPLAARPGHTHPNNRTTSRDKYGGIGGNWSRLLPLGV